MAVTQVDPFSTSRPVSPVSLAIHRFEDAVRIGRAEDLQAVLREVRTAGIAKDEAFIQTMRKHFCAIPDRCIEEGFQAALAFIEKNELIQEFKEELGKCISSLGHPDVGGVRLASLKLALNFAKTKGLLAENTIISRISQAIFHSIDESENNQYGAASFFKEVVDFAEANCPQKINLPWLVDQHCNTPTSITRLLQFAETHDRISEIRNLGLLIPLHPRGVHGQRRQVIEILRTFIQKYPETEGK